MMNYTLIMNYKVILISKWIMNYKLIMNYKFVMKLWINCCLWLECAHTIQAKPRWHDLAIYEYNCLWTSSRALCSSAWRWRHTILWLRCQHTLRTQITTKSWERTSSWSEIAVMTSNDPLQEQMHTINVYIKLNYKLKEHIKLNYTLIWIIN